MNINDGVLTHELPRNQRQERQECHDGEERDHWRREPVVALTTIKHQFHAAQPKGNEREADIVEHDAADAQFCGAAAQRRRFIDKDRDQPERREPDGHIDQKHPVPGVIVGDPAA
jgi:hypothetical protein